MAFEQRRYQDEVIEKVDALVGRGVRRILVCAPTGAGKTTIAARLVLGALARSKRSLFVAHRRELIRQPFCRFVRAGVSPEEFGIVMAGVPLPRGAELAVPATDTELWKRCARRRPSAPVQIASIDTLRHREAKPPADFVFVDEAHRSLAKSYRDLAAHYPEAVIIGLTATPSRGDGRGLKDAYDEMVVVSTYRELVALGYLVAPRVWTVPRLPDLSRVRVISGEYNAEDLEEACMQDALIGDIVEHYQRHGNGAPALAFATGVEHSRRIAQRFVSAGIAAAHVDANTPVEERDRAFADLAAGRVRVVSNCDIAGEGTDVPCVKCVISARPTMSLRVWLQQGGRGSRPHGGMPFVILDHAGNAAEHGLPQDDREWTLEGKKRRRGGGAPVWTCEECFAVNPLAAKACEECGSPRPGAEGIERGDIEERAGQLVEVRPLTDAEKCGAWETLCNQWRAMNARRDVPMKPAWVRYRFIEKFKSAPPPGCALPSWTNAEVARREKADRRVQAFDEIRAGRPVREAIAAIEADEDFLPPVTTRWA